MYGQSINLFKPAIHSEVDYQNTIHDYEWARTCHQQSEDDGAC